MSLKNYYVKLLIDATLTCGDTVWIVCCNQATISLQSVPQQTSTGPQGKM